MLELGLRGIKIHQIFKLAIDDERGIETYRPSPGVIFRCCFIWETTGTISLPGTADKCCGACRELRAWPAHAGGWRSWTQSLARLQPESVLYDTSSTLGMIDRELVLPLH